MACDCKQQVIHSRRQILCENFSVTNTFAQVHDATNVMLKTRYHKRQK